MNFLAHSYLSFSAEQIVGQFLQDFIPNKDRFSYSPGIVQGILLHREIDTYTDAHPEVHEAKKIFRPLVRLYAGAFVDVAFDYFLANSLPQKILKTHSQEVYTVLQQHSKILPETLNRRVAAMQRDNWLYNYRYDSGIQFSMQHVLNQAKYLPSDLPVFNIFLDKKYDLDRHFQRFFPDLEAHCRELSSWF